VASGAVGPDSAELEAVTEAEAELTPRPSPGGAAEAKDEAKDDGGDAFGTDVVERHVGVESSEAKDGVKQEQRQVPAARVPSAPILVGHGNTSAPGLKCLTAFDLVNQCGGIALNRLLLATQGREVVKVRQFTSAKPPLAVLQGIHDQLQDMGCDTRLQTDVYKAKGALLSPSGMIGIIIQSYAVSDSVHLVEIRRGKGDILGYHKLFNELVLNRINHLINVPPDMK